MNNDILLINSIQAHDYIEVQYALSQGANIENSGALHAASGTGRLDIVALLLSKGANVNTKGCSEGYLQKSITPLNHAVKKGHLHVVKELKMRSAEVFPCDLEAATWNGHLEMVKFFIDSGLSPDSVQDLLHIAVRSQNLSLVKYLLPLVKDVSAFDASGETALHKAIHLNDQNMMMLLLKAGANIEATCILPKPNTFNAAFWGYSPLALAVCIMHTKIVRLLLENGANVHTCKFNEEKRSSEIYRLLLRYGLQPSDNFTPLHLAAGEGDSVRLGELLASKKYELNTRADPFGTPLCEAARYGHEKNVSLLVKAGANIDLAGNHGCPLLLAVQGEHYQVVKLLLENRADVNNTSRETVFETDSSLEAAASQGSLQMVRLLLSYGAIVNKGRYAFSLGSAARNGHLEIVKLLLESDVDIKQKDYNGRAALHRACAYGSYGSSKVIELLLEKGAEINAQTDDQETPLYLCVESRKVGKALTLLCHPDVDVNTKKEDRSALQLISLLYNKNDPDKPRLLRMFHAKEVLQSGVLIPHDEALFFRIMKVGFTSLTEIELFTLYQRREEKTPLGEFVQEFEQEIKQTNKLLLYARNTNSYVQKILKKLNLPPDIVRFIASFINISHLPFDRGGQTWLKKICSIKK